MFETKFRPAARPWPGFRVSGTGLTEEGRVFSFVPHFSGGARLPKRWSRDFANLTDMPIYDPNGPPRRHPVECGCGVCAESRRIAAAAKVMNDKYGAWEGKGTVGPRVAGLSSSQRKAEEAKKLAHSVQGQGAQWGPQIAQGPNLTMHDIQRAFMEAGISQQYRQQQDYAQYAQQYQQAMSQQQLAGYINQGLGMGGFGSASGGTQPFRCQQCTDPIPHVHNAIDRFGKLPR